jgi:hypothetical protein
MWDKDDPKTKWFHLVIKVVAALVIFKVGVLVGEFRIVKHMVVGGGSHMPKMLFRSDTDGKGDAKFFNKQMDAPMMYWGGGGKQLPPPEAGLPVPSPTPGN